MLRTPGGWRLSLAYDIVPVPLISLERRDLALEAGRYGRVASIYNLLSDCASFGLSLDEAQQVIDQMVGVVKNWRALFARHKVEERSIEYISGAILPECFFRKDPISPP
jgi:serine/threonine-protein kinase HipA